MLPALNYAERDRIEGRLSVEEEAALVRTTGRLLAELGEARRADALDEAAATAADRRSPSSAVRSRATPTRSP